jgi:YHS domain-containing protein
MDDTEVKIHDPVCGREVARDTVYTSVYNGEKYYFHSRECKARFDKDPEQILAKERSAVC